MKTAAILVIGNEILTGKTEETNARFLIAELHALGVALRRIAMIPDDVADIAETLRDLAARFDHVFTSGGVGPTHDDVTMEGAARAFGRRCSRQPELEKLLRNHFGPAIHERNLRMADVPEGTELLRGDPAGWPVLKLENVYILPGVPEIFRRKFLSIRERFRSNPFALQAILLRADEGDIAQLLEQTQAEFPSVEIGSYPRLSGNYQVKVTLESKDADAVARATQALLAALPADLVVGREPA